MSKVNQHDNTRIEENISHEQRIKQQRVFKSNEKIIHAKFAVVKITQDVTVILKIRYTWNADGKATKFLNVEKTNRKTKAQQ